MDRYLIKIHSLIDVITNSSTEIYNFVTTNCVEDAYKLLNEILKIAGSDKIAEDLFKVHKEPDDWCKVFEILEYEDIEDKHLESLLTTLENKTGDEHTSYEENVVIPYLIENDRWEQYYDTEEEFGGTTMCITSIDDSSNMDIYGMFHTLFYSEERYG